jgi:hypothetical protein
MSSPRQIVATQKKLDTLKKARVAGRPGVKAKLTNTCKPTGKDGHCSLIWTMLTCESLLNVCSPWDLGKPFGAENVPT